MLRRTEKDTTSPVSLESLKAHLRVDSTADDTYITALADAALEVCESFTQRDFTDATYSLTLSGFPMRLPRPPLNEIVSIHYYDTADVLTELESTQYHLVKSDTAGASLQPVDCWPSVTWRPDAVQIVFTCGHVCPEAVKHAIKLLVGMWFEHREDVTEVSLAPISYGVTRLLAQVATI